MKVFSYEKYKQNHNKINWSLDVALKQLDGKEVINNRCKDSCLFIHDKYCINKRRDKLIFSDNVTILIRNGKKYVSKCCEQDVFDREKGLLLCLAKSIGIRYQDIENMLNNAEIEPKNKVQEIKKRAKKGEYVKITNCSLFPEQNGNVYQVLSSSDIFGESVGNFGDCESKLDVNPYEYVVLKNYKPKKITLSKFCNSKKRLAIKYNTIEQGRLLYDKMIERAFGKENTIPQDCFCEDKMFKYITNGTDYLYTRIMQVGDFYIKNNDVEVYNFEDVNLNK